MKKKDNLNLKLKKIKMKYFKKVWLYVDYTYLLFMWYHNDTYRLELLRKSNPPDILDF